MKNFSSLDLMHKVISWLWCQLTMTTSVVRTSATHQHNDCSSCLMFLVFSWRERRGARFCWKPVPVPALLHDKRTYSHTHSHTNTQVVSHLFFRGTTTAQRKNAKPKNNSHRSYGICCLSMLGRPTETRDLSESTAVQLLWPCWSVRPLKWKESWKDVARSGVCPCRSQLLLCFGAEGLCCSHWACST